MPDTEKVVSEDVEVIESTESVEPNADMDVDALMEHSSKQDEAEPSEESTSSEDEQSDKSGDDVKAPEGDVGTPEKSDDEVKEGDPIPYNRFKQVNDEKNQLTTDLNQSKTDLAEYQESLKDPEVLSLVLKKRGYSEEAISKYMKDNDITELQKEPETKEHDLTSIDGWNNSIEEKIQNALKPIVQAISQQQTSSEREKQQSDSDKLNARELTEAGTLATDTYGIERFGDPSSKDDMANPETAVYKIDQYLKQNPGDAGLGWVRSLKLAMSGQAIKQAEQKGADKEKHRQGKVKSAAMESESTTTTDEHPDPTWDVDKIMAWRETHPNYEE